MFKIKSINKVNGFIKDNIINILSFLIILQPIIDVMIGFAINLSFFSLTMSLVRFLILIFMLYYLVFICDNYNRKKVYISIFAILCYLLLYFVNQGFVVSELRVALKVFYFPLMFLAIHYILREKNTSIDFKYLLIALFIYSIVIIFGFITDTAFNSYLESKIGTSGYFYAANEVGGIIAILLPLCFHYVLNKINFKKIIYFLIVVGAIAIIGTKTPVISFIICVIYYVVKFVKKENMIKVFLIFGISIVAIIILFTKTPMYKNMVIHYEFLKVDSISDFIEKPNLIDHFLLGSRLKFLDSNTEIYMNSSLADKFLGIGYMSNPKLVEMDLFDILYRQGILGFIAYFGVVISILISSFKRYNRIYLLPIILAVLISSIVGHVLVAPAVSTFVAFILYGFMKEEKT